MVRFFREENGKVRCFACRNRCIIEEGKTGLCGVRGNENGEGVLLVYGKPAAVHVDPIEKKPLFHFYPGSLAYSIGTFGCNLFCLFCQNWELSQEIKHFSKFQVEKAREFIEKYSISLSPEEAVKEAKEYGCQGIAYTYNEPAIFSEYALDIAKLAKKEGLYNVYVSSGYETPEALDEICKWIDAFNIDLKFFSEESYRKISRVSLQGVLETIEELYKRKKWVEITTLVIPGINDSPEELKKTAEFIASLSEYIPWHVTRFYPHYKMLDKPITPLETLLKAKKIGEEAGLKFIYIGNVPQAGLENTYCPKCNALLIERFGFDILKNEIENGRCKYCGEVIPGVFG